MDEDDTHDDDDYDGADDDDDDDGDGDGDGDGGGDDDDAGDDDDDDDADDDDDDDDDDDAQYSTGRHRWRNWAREPHPGPPSKASIFLKASTSQGNIPTWDVPFRQKDPKLKFIY